MVRCPPDGHSVSAIIAIFSYGLGFSFSNVSGTRVRASFGLLFRIIAISLAGFIYGSLIGY